MKTPLDIMPEVMAANHRALLQLHASDSGLESQLAWEQLLRSLTSRYEDYIDQTLSKQDQFALANILENLKISKKIKLTVDVDPTNFA